MRRTIATIAAMISEQDIPHIVVGACLEVHRELGPGLACFAYKAALARELRMREIFFANEVPIHIDYKGQTVECAAYMDFVIEKQLVLQVLVEDRLLPLHRDILSSHLRHSGYPAGFLINFRARELRKGIKRVILAEGVARKPTAWE